MYKITLKWLKRGPHSSQSSEQLYWKQAKGDAAAQFLQCWVTNPVTKLLEM